MTKIILSSLFALGLLTSVQAYDAEKAAQFNGFFSHMTQKACADSTFFVKPDALMQMLRENKPMLLLDVRTDGEASVVALGVPGALHIPVEHLFKKANLDKLPTDRPVIIVCYSGSRATMAAMALKMSGVGNVQVLKGGIVALAAANSVKNAPVKE